MSQRNLCAIVYETRHNYYQVRIAHSVGRYKRTVKFDVIASHVEAVLGQKEYAKMRALMRDGGGGGKSEELNTLIRRWWTMARLSDPQAFVAFANAYIVKKKADGGDGGGGGAASSGVRGRNSRGGGSQTKKKTTTTPRKNAKKQHAEEEVTTTTKADDDDLGRLEKLLADKETEIESKDRLIAELTREVGGKDRAIAELTRAKEELARAKEELARANDGKITVDLAEIRATIESAIAVGATTEARKRIKLTVLQRWHPDKVSIAELVPLANEIAKIVNGIP